MRAAPSSCLATLVAAAVGLAGCSSFESRASDNGAAYHALTYGTQQRLERGMIHIGDTPEMVILALGKPDEKVDAANTAGYESVWVYTNKAPQIENREQTGWSEVLVPSLVSQNDVVIQKAVMRDVYRTQLNAGVRVAFAAGVVSSVEQLIR